MANISDNLGYGAVLRPETSDLALGGNETNFPGKQLSQLASRDAFLLSLLGGSSVQEQTNFSQFKAIGQAAIAQGRLTLETGVAVSSTDQTAKTTLFYTPYSGDYISLWNATDSRWDVYQFTERSLSLSGLTANTNYDIFIYDNAGTLTLSAVAWSNSGAGTSARTTAISLKNGVWVNSSNNRRYLGTIRITGTTGQCEDSRLKRFVWNAQNDRARSLLWQSAVASWTYNSATWRSVNADATARVEVVIGLPGIRIDLACLLNAYENGFPAIALDNTTAPTSLTEGIGADPVNVSGDTVGIFAMYKPQNLAVGYHYFQMIERVVTGGITATMNGVVSGRNQTGIIGEINA